MIRSFRRRTSGDDAGFTLIEVVVVCAIVALTLSVALPLMRPMKSGLLLDEATRDIADALRLARGRAVRHNRQMVVRLDPGAREIVDSTKIRSRTLPAGITLDVVVPAANGNSSGGAEYIFYPDGSASGGGITLSDGRRANNIVVDWLTGRVATHVQGRGSQ